MRIIKEFNYGLLKCTLFHNNNKYSLKLENDSCAVNYKLGSMEISNFEIIPSVFEIPVVKNNIALAFQNLEESKQEIVRLLSSQEPEEFEEII